MNATVTECSLDWLCAVGDGVGKGPKGYFPVPSRKVRGKKEQIPPRRTAPCRNVEALSRRERSGSLLPKSRAERGNSPLSDRTFTKRRGEYGEAAFLTKAASMGIGVAKPWGDSDRYYFIIDAGGRLLRVQVKSAHCECAQPGGGYHIRAQPHRRTPYTTSEIDLLVAYIVPEDIWYVFPPSAFQHIKGMRLFPHHKQKLSKFEQYREAWEWVWK